jgi:DeoR/GlpR family transcriptional regulator of sugar metabolism
MSDEKNIRLILSGGIVRQGEKSLIGDLAYLAFREIFVDRLFLGVGGIDAQVGLTEFEMQDAQVKKEMIKSAKEVIVLADASKFQQVAFSFFARLDQIDHLVCDKEPPQPLLDELIKNNVEIHVVTD